MEGHLEHRDRVASPHLLGNQVQSAPPRTPPKVKPFGIDPDGEVGMRFRQHPSQIHQRAPGKLHLKGSDSVEGHIDSAAIGEQRTQKHLRIEGNRIVLPNRRRGELLRRRERNLQNCRFVACGTRAMAAIEEVLQPGGDALIGQGDERLELARIHAEQGSQMVPVLGEA